MQVTLTDVESRVLRLQCDYDTTSRTVLPARNGRVDGLETVRVYRRV